MAIQYKQKEKFKMDLWETIDDPQNEDKKDPDELQETTQSMIGGSNPGNLLKMSREDLGVLARAYMNRDDLCFPIASKIEPKPGFEDFLIHGQPNKVEHQTVNGQWVEYSPQDFADIIRNDPEYHGGNIRLLACQSGRLDGGFAQQLADIMQVQVLAPTEILWLSKDGDTFLSDSAVLAELWEQGEKVIETGRWKLFLPRKGE